MNKVLTGIFAVALGLSFTLSAEAAPATYVFDKGHSSIGFGVKHMQVGTTRGQFNDYEGKIILDTENIEASRIEVTIQANSIDTDLEARDAHLKNSDFLDVEKFPVITFYSTRILASKPVEAAAQPSSQEGVSVMGQHETPSAHFEELDLSVEGKLTIRGVTKEVTIPLELSGPVQGMKGEVVGLSGQLMINRKDFGVSWNKTLDNGGFAVGDNVRITIEIEAGKE